MSASYHVCTCDRTWKAHGRFNHTVGVLYLVALRVDGNDHLKVFSLREGHLTDLLLSLPLPILECVEDHLIPAVPAGIAVECYVTSLKLPALQVDVKSVH